MRKIIIVLLIATGFCLFLFRQPMKTNVETLVKNSRLPKNSTTFAHVSSVGDDEKPSAQEESVAKKQNILPENKTITLPQEFNLDVPFTSQAPFADWSMPYKEGCEEAAAIMVNAFYKNQILTPDNVKKEIDAMVNWQMENFQEHRDLNAAEMVRFIKRYYGYQDVEILQNPAWEEVKKQILSGHPLIAPTAGRLLNNPHFRQPGPIYHMLVLRGWTKNGMIITNDPGTQYGENYLYAPEIVSNALHDWNNGDVSNGAKVFIVINK